MRCTLPLSSILNLPMVLTYFIVVLQAWGQDNEMNYHSVFLSGGKRLKISNICASGLNPSCHWQQVKSDELRALPEADSRRSCALLIPSFRPESRRDICFVTNAETGVTISLLFESLYLSQCLFCFHNSQTWSIQWHWFSHSLSQEFQETRRILNRSFDSCVGQAGHLGQSDGGVQPPMMMNSIYERCAGEWWARRVFISVATRHWDVQGEGHPNIGLIYFSVVHIIFAF